MNARASLPRSRPLAARSLLLALALAAGCSKAPEESEPAMPEPAQLLATMEAAIQKRMAGPEHTDPQVQVQHVLIGVTHPRMPGVVRTPAEAAARAAEVYYRVEQGEEFDTLERNYSDDIGHPGIYTMTLGGESQAGSYARKDMAPSFGDVAWRLAVGEVGVAPHDPTRSPFGYHIIKRLK